MASCASALARNLAGLTPAGHSLLDEVGKKLAVVLAANLKFDRSLGFGIEQRRILYSDGFGDCMMVGIGEPELLADIAQQLQAFGRFGMAALQSLGQDRPIGFALLRDT